MTRGVFLLVAGTLCCNIALAQEATPPGDAAKPQDDAAAALIGNWELSNADHDKVCRLSFRNETAPNGNKLDIDRNCPSVFPSTKDIVAWKLDNYGGLRLLDAAGNSIIELTEVESGMYDGFTPEEGRYILQAAAAVQLRSADDMAGDWAVARGTGKPICLLTLSIAATAAGPDNLALKIKPGCDALITRFGPTAWHMDRGELVLLGPRGQTWRFEENDANTWQRLPESPDPVLLVRQ